MIYEKLQKHSSFYDESMNWISVKIKIVFGSGFGCGDKTFMTLRSSSTSSLRMRNSTGLLLPKCKCTITEKPKYNTSRNKSVLCISIIILTIFSYMHAHINNDKNICLVIWKYFLTLSESKIIIQAYTQINPATLEVKRSSGSVARLTANMWCFNFTPV